MSNILSPANILVCFSQKDSKWYRELQTYSKPMINNAIIRFWSQQDIDPGIEVKRYIEEIASSAKIIIFLVTPALLEDEYEYELIKIAMARLQRGDVSILPVYVSYIDWTSSPFSTLQHFPSDGKPLSKRRDRERTFTELVSTIRRMVENQESSNIKPSVDVLKNVQSAPSSYQISELSDKPLPKIGSLGFLHLTDLHVGQEGQPWLWPGFRKQFFDDLTIVHKQAGPFDAVFFTGDLVFSGKKREFLELDKVLSDIWSHLKMLGSNPVLLAIPGNHDLQRPPESDNILEFAGLDMWHEPVKGRKIRDLLIGQQAGLEGNSLRQMVSSAFKDYVDWFNQTSLKSRATDLINGILPGDFSLSLTTKNLKVGIMGLNTSFLHLSEGNFEGRLDLRLEQFHAASGGDAYRWFESNDGCLLLSHHPAEWLHSKAREVYFSEIYPPKNFMVHLFGHMHQPASQSLSQGGAQPRNMVQGASLFGLESYTSADGTQLLRTHGYSAGRIMRNGDQMKLRIFPRIRVKKQGNLYGLVADPSFSLDEYGAYEIKVR